MKRPPALPQPSQAEITEDSDAIEEARALDRGVDLDDEARTNKHKRKESRENHINRVMIAFIYVVSIGVLGVFLSVVWNEAAPERWRYLTDIQTHSLIKFLSTGFLGAILSSGISRL